MARQASAVDILEARKDQLEAELAKMERTVRLPWEQGLIML